MAASAQSEVGLKERFYRDFQQAVTALQEQIESLNTTSAAGSERNNAIDECLAGIDRLSHEVKDAASYIPAYDQRSYSQTIKALSEKLQATRNAFNPPKKFSFKSRKNAPASSGPDSGESQKLTAPITPNTISTRQDTGPSSNEASRPHEHADEDIADGIPDGPGIQRPSLSHATKVAVTNHKHLHLKLPLSASHATSSGTLSALSHSFIDLSAPTSLAPFSALYLKNITSSLLICGQTAGAVHITSVHNSVLVISCRQFRMHASTNVDVYLHSASRPIIEDCEKVRFAPMPRALGSAGMEGVKNCWDQIDDFGWLKVEASPNFRVLAEGERVGEGGWERVLGGEDLGEVLGVVGIQ